MHERERSRTGPPGETTESTLPGSNNLSQIQSDTERLLGEASRAIDAVLSGDSLALLRANRQRGGQ